MVSGSKNRPNENQEPSMDAERIYPIGGHLNLALTSSLTHIAFRKNVSIPNH